MSGSRMLFGVIPIYGLLIALGVLLAAVYAARQEARLGLPKDTAVDVVLWAVPPGIIGARLYYVAFTWERYAPDPLSVLYVWEGGLAIYGGIIGGILGILLYAKLKKLPLPALTDMVVPAVILAQAIGRWGNFFNGEAYGNPVTDSALQFFPYAVRVGGMWYQATFFYESMWDLAGFFVLHLTRKKWRRPGSLTLLYFVFYGFGRMLIEGLRSDSLWWGPFRVSQVLSGVLAAVCGAALYLRERK